MKSWLFWIVCAPMRSLPFMNSVLSTTVTFDDAHNYQHKQQESNGQHHSYEPPCSSNILLWLYNDAICLQEQKKNIYIYIYIYEYYFLTEEKYLVSHIFVVKYTKTPQLTVLSTMSVILYLLILHPPSIWSKETTYPPQ